MSKNNVTIAPALAGLPARVTRRVGAKIITDQLFPVSHRTLEAWPVRVQRVNGKALMDTAELLAFARSKLDAAPVIQGGRSRDAA